ncbi:MAG: MgtC/SapB family protein [Candidatus Jorgensenbacteria bacterium]|nr:MgtC/SapB family protein [Candidatus Jorgensenbacteria bacterium]
MNTMLTFEEMLLRLAVAVVLGAIVGFGREMAGKEAGVRTDIIVAAGAALFTIAALVLPHLLASSPEHLNEILARNSGFLSIIANIVVGIGFLGAGIIVKQGVHVRSVTTAATVWFVAALGVLTGLGLLAFASVAAVALTVLLAILGRFDLKRVLTEETQKSKE